MGGAPWPPALYKPYRPASSPTRLPHTHAVARQLLIDNPGPHSAHLQMNAHPDCGCARVSVDSTSVTSVEGQVYPHVSDTVRRLPPIGAFAGGTFCGSIADWCLPSRYYTERNAYNEKISKEISLGSTATTQAPSFTTYDTMHAGEPTFEYSAGP